MLQSSWHLATERPLNKVRFNMNDIEKISKLFNEYEIVDFENIKHAKKFNEIPTWLHEIDDVIKKYDKKDLFNLLTTAIKEKLINGEKFESVMENLIKFKPYAQRFGPEIERILNRVCLG